MQCARARDHAVGLKDRILRLLSDNVDNARFFRPGRSTIEVLTAIAGLGTLIWALVVWDIFQKQEFDSLYTNSFWFWSTLLAVLWAYPLISTRYFPNCIFESKRRLELDEQRSWAKKAVWSLIASNLVVGVLGTAIAARVVTLLPWNH